MAARLFNLHARPARKPARPNAAKAGGHIIDNEALAREVIAAMDFFTRGAAGKEPPVAIEIYKKLLPVCDTESQMGTVLSRSAISAKVRFSPSNSCSRPLIHPLDSVTTVRRLVAFYVDQHNRVLPHSAFHGQTSDEITSAPGKRYRPARCSRACPQVGLALRPTDWRRARHAPVSRRGTA